MSNKRPSVKVRAYIAGIIDGEGSIGIIRRKSEPSGCIFVAVYNTDPRIPVLMKSYYGGCIHETKPKNGWRVLFHWRASNLAAEKLLRDVLPFLILKKEQASLCLFVRRYSKRYKLMPGRFRKPKDLEKRLKLVSVVEKTIESVHLANRTRPKMEDVGAVSK